MGPGADRVALATERIRGRCKEGLVVVEVIRGTDILWVGILDFVLLAEKHGFDFEERTAWPEGFASELGACDDLRLGKCVRSVICLIGIVGVVQYP